MKKQISIIIVTYNSEKHIFDCLNSVFENNDIGDMLEVIVVDNNSTGQLEMFNSIRSIYNDRVKLLANQSNLGYGSGNNYGVENSLGDIIVIMNPDVRLVQPLFHSMCMEFNENEKIGMLGFKQYYSENKAALSYSLNYQFGPIQSVFLTVLYNRLNIYNYKKMYLSGAFFCIKKDVFDFIGKFDERLFLYAEENDLHFRFRNLLPDMIIKYRSDIKYLHLADDRPVRFLDQKRMFDSNLFFYRKNNLNVKRYIRNEVYKTYILTVISLLRFKSNNIPTFMSWIKFLKTQI